MLFEAFFTIQINNTYERTSLVWLNCCRLQQKGLGLNSKNNIHSRCDGIKHKYIR
jgi:hypothetical protein